MPTTACTSARTYTREIPLGFNGYVTVAQPSQRITAAELQAGDTLILDGYVSRVSGIRPLDLFTGRDLTVKHPGHSVVEVLTAATREWPVLHISGDVNVIRFPHELVSVIRPA
jgi:hypothetical protein